MENKIYILLFSVGLISLMNGLFLYSYYFKNEKISKFFRFFSVVNLIGIGFALIFSVVITYLK